MPEFTLPGQRAVETTAGDMPETDGRIYRTISQARIFSPGAAQIPESTLPDQPAVETTAGDMSEPDGSI
jgi:hypothetical protein